MGHLELADEVFCLDSPASVFGIRISNPFPFAIALRSFALVREPLFVRLLESSCRAATALGVLAVVEQVL